MGLFDSFKDIFSVGNTISQSSNIKPDDVLKTKNALAQIGHYEVPSFGITDTPDMAMINGLKRFQQNNGLKVDGIMKPNGPTESKIGETLANQTFQSSDVLEKTKGTPKPKVPKIDPLTGLPEIKMPKPKKPVVNVWGQANNENANPWFQSSKLKPVEDETHSANTRSLDGLLKSSVNGALPNLYADSIKRDGAKAINEYANFMQQLQGRNEDRVDGFHTEVVNRLPQNLKQAFAELETEPAKGDAQDVRNMEYKLPDRYKAFTPERIQQLQEAYAKDPENFATQSKAQNGKVKTYQVTDGNQQNSKRNPIEENAGKTSQENNSKPESAYCEGLKSRFESARKIYDSADEKYNSLSQEHIRLGKEYNQLKGDLQGDIASLGLGSITGRLLAYLASGMFQKIIDALTRKHEKRETQSILGKLQRLGEISSRRDIVGPKVDSAEEAKKEAWKKYDRLIREKDDSACEHYGW